MALTKKPCCYFQSCIGSFACTTLERTFTRKFKEILLSLEIERVLSKEENSYLEKLVAGNLVGQELLVLESDKQQLKVSKEVRSVL